VALATSALVLGSGAGWSSAAGLPGFVDVTNDTSQFDFGPASSKTERAYCPTGTRVVGGGGGMLGGEVAEGLVITQMRPVHPLFGRDYYEVTVADPTGAVDGWGTRATAICAPRLTNMSIEVANTTLSSDSVQLAEAQCPPGRKVVGNGAWTNNTAGQVGLQVLRASTDGTRVYAQAHEDGDGYSGQWNVRAFAVCANAPAGYEIKMADSPQSDSETTKNGWAACSPGKTLLSGGAAVSFSAPGQVALQFFHAYAYPTSGDVNGYAAENSATSADWGFMVTQAICGG
jgi:hypothetical protein